MQIARVIVKAVFVYGNLVDAGTILLKLIKKPEIRYLMKFRGQQSKSEKYYDVADKIIVNIKGYLSEMMATKGPRKKLASQAYRTVVAACSGPNLIRQKRLTLTSRVLVSCFVVVLLYKFMKYFTHSNRKYIGATYSEA